MPSGTQVLATVPVLATEWARMLRKRMTAMMAKKGTREVSSVA